MDIRERSIGVDMRLWVLATPVDGIHIDMSLVSQVREIRNPKRWFAGLGFLPVGLRAPLFNKFVAAMQQRGRSCRMWPSGGTSVIGHARVFAVPMAKLCPSERIAPSSIPEANDVGESQFT